MLFWLLESLSKHYHAFNVFQYITFRALLSALTALGISLFIGPYFIRRLSARQIKQIIRQDGPLSHLQKAGTPTMGGSLILIAIALTVLLWGDLTNSYIWLLLAVTMTFGLIGWFDDHLKLKYKNSRGLSARLKFFLQSLAGLAAAIFLFYIAKTPGETQLIIPFFKNSAIDLGWLFIPFVFFVIVGTSNAVNLTDGLDGLAILPTVMIGAALGVFAYATGNYYFAKYLYIPFVYGAGEVVIFCGAIAGAGLGFLWYNTYPAQVFMGDTGSLTIGAVIAVLAIAVRKELLIPILAGIFLVENLSVVLQVSYFKYTKKRFGEGKRIFKMAPLHHHYQKIGYHESKIVTRFWIVGIMLAVLAIVTLKLR